METHGNTWVTQRLKALTPQRPWGRGFRCYTQYSELLNHYPPSRGDASWLRPTTDAKDKFEFTTSQVIGDAGEIRTNFGWGISKDLIKRLFGWGIITKTKPLDLEFPNTFGVDMTDN